MLRKFLLLFSFLLLSNLSLAENFFDKNKNVIKYSWTKTDLFLDIENDTIYFRRRNSSKFDNLYNEIKTVGFKGTYTLEIGPQKSNFIRNWKEPKLAEAILSSKNLQYIKIKVKDFGNLTKQIKINSRNQYLFFDLSSVNFKGNNKAKSSCCSNWFMLNHNYWPRTTSMFKKQLASYDVNKRIEAERLEAQEQKQKLEAARLAKEEAKRIAEEKNLAEERARKQAQEKAKKLAEEKEKRIAEEKKLAKERARKQAQEKARKLAEAKARKKAEEKAKKLAKEKEKKLAEEKAKRIAEEKARKEAEEKVKKLAEEKEKLEKELKLRKLADKKAKKVAEEKKLAEERARKQAQERAKKLAEKKSQQKAFDDLVKKGLKKRIKFVVKRIDGSRRIDILNQKLISRSAQHEFLEPLEEVVFKLSDYLSTPLLEKSADEIVDIKDHLDFIIKYSSSVKDNNLKLFRLGKLPSYKDYLEEEKKIISDLDNDFKIIKNYFKNFKLIFEKYGKKSKNNASELRRFEKFLLQTFQKEYGKYFAIDHVPDLATETKKLELARNSSAYWDTFFYQASFYVRTVRIFNKGVENWIDLKASTNFKSFYKNEIRKLKVKNTVKEIEKKQKDDKDFFDTLGN